MKYLLLGLLIFLLYRMVAKPKSIDAPPEKEPLREPEEEGFVDYEELD